MPRTGGSVGMPGTPEMWIPAVGMGGPGMGLPGFTVPQASIPPACQQIMAMRDETQKNATAIQALTNKANAQHKPPDPVETCTLFKAFVSSDSRYIQIIQTNGQTCGVPPAVIKQIQEGHTKATEISRQVCDAADHSRPFGPGTFRIADPGL